MPADKPKRDPRAASALAGAKRLAETAKEPAATGTAIPSVTITPSPSQAPSQVPRASGEALVAWPIELLVAVRNEPERSGIGYSFYSVGLASDKALAVILNRLKLVISKALSKSDVPLVKFFYALLVAENLALRYATRHWWQRCRRLSPSPYIRMVDLV
jgi:hypothetical protein